MHSSLSIPPVHLPAHQTITTVPFLPSFPPHHQPPLSKHASASTLNSLNLRLTPSRPSKPSRQLVPVEELALGRLDRAQRRAGVGADCTSVRERWRLGLLPAQRAVLLCFLAVLGEGVGELVGGRGWVRVGRVVDLWGGWVSRLRGLVERAWVGGLGRVRQGGQMGGMVVVGYVLAGGVLLPRNLIMGVRCAHSALVKRIVR